MTALDHIGLSVADLEGQAEWYARALGLVPRDPGGIPEIGLRVVFLVEPDEGWALELLHRPGSHPAPPARSAPEHVLTQGYGHICVRSSDVDSLFERLVQSGATSIMEPTDSPISGVRMAFVADPEGNFIEMLDRPRPLGSPPEAS